MRVGFIGAGGIATNYLESIDGLDDVTVSAVCDIDERRAERAASPRNADVYTDHHELYNDAAFDAVFICIPPFAHTDQELQAIERDIDMFVAKPVSLTAEKANEVETALRNSDVLAQAGYMWRYADSIDRVIDVISDRQIGMINGRVWTTVPPSDWWTVEDRSGGQIVEQATHVYDLVRYLGGDSCEVYARGENLLGVDVDFEDVTSATMQHENGIVSTVSNTCGAPDNQYFLDIVAEDVRLHIDCLDNSLYGTINGDEISFNGERDGYTRQLEEFVSACQDRDTSRIRSDYSDAAKTLRTTLAVRKSLKTDEPVTVK